MFDVVALNERVKAESASLSRLTDEVARVIVGQKYMVERLMISLLADGHVLLEGVPGLAKTTAIKTLASAIDTGFARVQFTPDLLPADLTGTQVYNPKDASFSVKQGPVFTNLLLADEINRAPAKVQSALLEAMQERHVTIGGSTFKLPEPFMVLATQNPIEQEGTYPLPEAQVDRFMLKLNVGYPTREEERDILERQTGAVPAPVQPVIHPEQILRMRQVVREIYMDDKIKKYIVDIVFATREPEAAGLDLKPLIAFGASPRATIYLAQAARAHAALRGRGYVTPEDVKAIGLDVLRHRVIVTYEAEAEEVTPEEVARRILDKVEVP
ncbi:MAG TPA: AAA family ATPase [Candidatus Eisenbacteria bacterium]